MTTGMKLETEESGTKFGDSNSTWVYGWNLQMELSTPPKLMGHPFHVFDAILPF
jgi:hypothetical protein